MKKHYFETSLTDCIPLLRAHAWKLTKNSLKMEDLIQDTLCRALYKRHLYKQDQNFRGWLLTIMRNIFINEYNRSGKRKTIELVESYIELENQVGKETTIDRVRLNYVKQTMLQLPERMRVALVLYATGYQYEEIARFLNEPVGTIKSRIFLARKSMQHRKKGMI